MLAIKLYDGSIIIVIIHAGHKDDLEMNDQQLNVWVCLLTSNKNTSTHVDSLNM